MKPEQQEIERRVVGWSMSAAMTHNWSLMRF